MLLCKSRLLCQVKIHFVGKVELAFSAFLNLLNIFNLLKQRKLLTLLSLVCLGYIVIVADHNVTLVIFRFLIVLFFLFLFVFCNRVIPVNINIFQGKSGLFYLFFIIFFNCADFKEHVSLNSLKDKMKSTDNLRKYNNIFNFCKTCFDKRTPSSLLNELCNSNLDLFVEKYKG